MRKFFCRALLCLFCLRAGAAEAGEGDPFALSTTVFDAAWVAAGSVYIANPYYVPTGGESYSIDMGMYEYGAGQSYTNGNPPVTGASNQTLTYSSATGLVTNNYFTRYYNGSHQTGVWSGPWSTQLDLTAFHTGTEICNISAAGIQWAGSYWIPHYNANTVGSRYVAAFNPATGHFDFSATAMALWDSDGDGWSDYQELEYVWAHGLARGVDNVYNQKSILENPNTPAAARLAVADGYYWYYDAGTNSVLRWNGITLDRVRYIDAPEAVRAHINANLSALTGDFTGLIAKAGSLQNTATLFGGIVLLQEGMSVSTMQNSGEINLTPTLEGFGWLSGGSSVMPRVTPLAESERYLEDTTGVISITGTGSTLENTGIIRGDSSTRIELSATEAAAIAALYNRNELVAGTLTLRGSGAQLNNSGQLQVEVAMEGADANEFINETGGVFVGGVQMSTGGANDLRNTAGGVFIGGVSMSAGRNNSLHNEAGGVFVAPALTLSAGGSNSLHNAGSLSAASISMHCDHTEIINAGTLVSDEIVLDANITNRFEAAPGSTTLAGSLQYQPTSPDSAENRLVISEVGGINGGGFVAGVRFLNQGSQNIVSITDSDVTFTEAQTGWGNNAGDTFTATDSVLRAPNGLLLGGSAGGGTFRPEQVLITGQVGMQNITVAGAPTAPNAGLMHVAGELRLDGTTFMMEDLTVASTQLRRYGDAAIMASADQLLIGAGGVYAETPDMAATRIDNAEVLFAGVAPLYPSLRYVWTAADGMVGVRLLFQNGWFEPHDKTGGGLGRTFDEMVQNPATFPAGMQDLLDHLSTTAPERLREALDQLNGQRNLTAAEIKLAEHALSAMHGTLGSRFDAWREQRRLEREGFALCGSRRYAAGSRAASGARKTADPGQATYSNIEPSNKDCAGCDDGLVMANVRLGDIENVRRFVLEPFAQLYGSSARQGAYGRAMSGYDANLYGGIVGLNFSSNADWNAGGFIDLAKGSSKPATYGSIEDTVVRLGGYSSYNLDAFSWDSVLSAGAHLFESRKNLQFLGGGARSKYTGYEAAWYNALAYRFELPGGFELSPYQTLTLSYLTTGERSEEGAPLKANMRHAAVSSLSIQDNLGFKISKVFMPRPCLAVVPRFFADYEFGASSTSKISSAFIAAPQYDWDTPVEFASTSRANFGLGVNTYFGTRFSIDGNLYTKLWSGGYLYGGNLGIGLKF